MSTQKMTPRRKVLLGLSASGLACLWPRFVRAGAAYPVPLGELVESSRLALVATPREARSNWEGEGRNRRIVTYSRIEVHQPIDGRHPDDSELFVRTLGGTVGEVGQIVHGEAELSLGRPAVFFLRNIASGLYGLTAMAQGHYPLIQDDEGARRLTPSPKLADFVQQDPHCAVNKLRGKTVSAAERIVLEELGR